MKTTPCKGCGKQSRDPDEVIRYTVKGLKQAEHEDHIYTFVRYSDYTRLAAEVERLRDIAGPNAGKFEDEGKTYNLMDWQAMLQTELGILRVKRDALAERVKELEEPDTIAGLEWSQLKATNTTLREALEELEGPLERLHDAKWATPEWDGEYNVLMETVEAKRQALKGAEDE